MAGYVAWYGKKREALAEHERQLIAALGRGAEAAVIAEAAESVRAAQIRALKAKRAQLPPREPYSVANTNLDREIAFWSDLPADAIINGYLAGRLQGHRSHASRRGFS